MAREMAKANLKANWAELVSSGDMDLEELVRSLEDQIDGYEDLSLDELTEEMAEILGWEFGDLTDEQVDEWEEIINEAAEEYLSTAEIAEAKAKAEWNFVDDRGRESIAIRVLMARGWNKTGAEEIASDLYWKLGVMEFDDLISVAEDYEDR